MAGKYRQRGISMFTLLFILVVLGAVGAMVLQAFPSIVEYQASLKAINRAKDEATVAGVRAAFDRSAAIDNITSISGKDIEVTKEGDQTVVSFAYNKEFHMFGPAWLTLKYEGQSHQGR
jgi:hypothetical protein